jgi:uncharacterized membrane protein YraQ (UPF0718 family)
MNIRSLKIRMTIFDLFLAGLNALKEYILLHVLTCLIPAFLLAGAMVTFISKEAIIGRLGPSASKLKSFPVAAGGSFFVAACSCTVIPVASGIYHAGAGIGVASIILWVAPAANILALVYTGSIIGPEMAAARIIAALSMAFIVGGVMTLAFKKEESIRNKNFKIQVEKKGLISKKDAGLLILLVVALLAPNYLVLEGPYLYKVYIWGVAMAAVAVYAWLTKEGEEIKRWLGESLWFVKIIFPLLLLGVFLVGIIGAVLPEEWIKIWLGGQGIMQSFIATLIGAIAYFATMTEAPFVHTLMGLGMGKGPALALLLTGPGLSLPNWLAIARTFGVKKTLVYVPTIVAMGTLVGWVAGLVL